MSNFANCGLKCLDFRARVKDKSQVEQQSVTLVFFVLDGDGVSDERTSRCVAVQTDEAEHQRVVSDDRAGAERPKFSLGISEMICCFVLLLFF